MCRCVAESGATGPTFIPPDCTLGFTAIAISGAGCEDVVLVSSEHSDREANMWDFTFCALEIFEATLAQHAEHG